MPNISMEEAMKLLADAGLNFAESALRIILVIVAGYIITKVVKVAVKHLEAILIRLGEGAEDVPGATRKRVTTLMNVLRTISIVVIWGIVVVVSLEQIGLAVGPILAAAGVLGLAVGFVRRIWFVMLSVAFSSFWKIRFGSVTWPLSTGPEDWWKP